MSPLVTLPNALEDGVDTAFGSDVRENDQAIVDVLHQIDRQNLSTTPNFPGSCLSTTAGERVPMTAIEDDAITAAKLADAVLDVNDSQRAVTGDHIRLGAVQRKHLATTPGAQAVSYAQMDILAQTTAFSFVVGADTAESIRGWGVSRKTTGANYEFLVWGICTNFSSGIVGNTGSLTMAPATPIPTANYVVLACYLADIAYVAATRVFSGNFITVALKIA